MSEHQRGAWGSRDDSSSVAAATAAAAASSVWWPSAVDQQSQHQQLLTHQQQQLAAAVQQQHEAAARSTAAAAAAQQFLSYKMANNNFQNIISSASTNSINSTHTINSGGGGMRYDYGGGGGRPGDAALANQAAQAAAQAAAQWWSYPASVAGLQNNPNLQNHLQNANAVNSLLNKRMPRGRMDSKPRGRMTAYAFFVQTCREEHKKKHPDETVIFKEFSKKCAERWKVFKNEVPMIEKGRRIYAVKVSQRGLTIDDVNSIDKNDSGGIFVHSIKTMSDKEKKRFHEMADKDKKRYDTEMQSYVPPKGEKLRGKKRKQMKDPNAPKRSLSAFFWFCNDERGQVKANNPDYGVGDIAKELGRKWADAEPHTKQKYEAMAEKDKARYEREMMEYKKKSKPAPIADPVSIKESDGEEPEEEDEDDDD